MQESIIPVLEKEMQAAMKRTAKKQRQIIGVHLNRNYWGFL
jgi:hypothetical protein